MFLWKRWEAGGRLQGHPWTEAMLPARTPHWLPRRWPYPPALTPSGPFSSLALISLSRYKNVRLLRMITASFDLGPSCCSSVTSLHSKSRRRSILTGSVFLKLPRTVTCISESAEANFSKVRTASHLPHLMAFCQLLTSRTSEAFTATKHPLASESLLSLNCCYYYFSVSWVSLSFRSS